MAGLGDLLGGAGVSVSEDVKKENFAGQKERDKDNYNYNRNSNNNKSNNRSNNRSNNKNTYVGAPYNFVPINNKVLEKKVEDMNVHGKLEENLISGEISYKFVAKTPIFISDGKKDSAGNDQSQFTRNERGEYVIPGSTVRGLIRNNVQILGLSCINDDIDDYSLMYRNVGGKGIVAEEYKNNLIVETIENEFGGSVSVLKDVEAGYLKNVGNKYILYGTEGDNIYGDKSSMNYYVISERYIVDKYFDCINERKDFPYPIFLKDGKSIMQHTFKKRFKMQIKNLSVCSKNIKKDISELNSKAKKIKYQVNKIEKKGKINIYAEINQEGEDGYYLIEKNNSGRTNISIYDKTGKCLYNKGQIHYIGDKNQIKNPKTNKFESLYKPYEIKCLYKIDNKKRVTEIIPYSENKHGYLEGYVVSTGEMNEKKSVYVIPKKKEDNIIKEFDAYNDKTIKSYIVDFNKKKNTLNTFGGKEHFALPPKDCERPTFFIKAINNRWYLGFTPRLRLFYDHTIKEGLKQEKPDFDYAKSLFGTTNDNAGYKSKLSFTDANIYGTYQKSEDDKRVLAEPKPSSYMDYIMQRDSDETTYNSSDFKLRGIKQYWLHDGIVPVSGEVKDNVSTKLHPLASGTEFTGKIRFNNLTKDELGLLVWSIKLENNSMMNVGMAKSFGYGVISVEDVVVKTVDLEKAYSLDNALEFDPFKDEDADSLIKEYKDKASEELGNSIDKVPEIQNFFLIKDATKKPDEKTIRYMSIDNKEYQNRGKSLQQIKELVK